MLQGCKILGRASKKLAALERQEKITYAYFERNIVTTIVPSFLGGSSQFLQVTRSTITARMSLNFDKIPSSTTELAALEHLKNQ